MKNQKEEQSIYNDMPPVFLSERRFKEGYIVRKEFVYVAFFDPEAQFYLMANAYNLNGDWIGQPRDARFLCVKRGIKPELITPLHSVCSIGFCEKEQKWYGWSHRAIVGFSIGDRVFERNYMKHLPEKRRDKIPFVKHGSIRIRTLAQAKIAAIRFAEYVG